LKHITTTLNQTVTIPASPKKVYQAYTDPKKHATFTGNKATGKPVEGGKFTAWDGYIFGKFLELNEDKRVVQEWTTTDWIEGYPASKLELTFKAVAEGTKITMIHSDVPKEQADEIAEGWNEFYWNPLKKYFGKKSKT
jgi:activator of HSP90 ATPase